jgi:hypothetical protein
MVIIELLDNKIVIACIYRTPDGNLDIFLKKLELVIQKVALRERILILSGD